VYHGEHAVSIVVMSFLILELHSHLGLTRAPLTPTTVWQLVEASYSSRSRKINSLCYMDDVRYTGFLNLQPGAP